MVMITDTASLTSAVTEYLAREEDATLIARIPSFIQLTEAKLNRELMVRQMEVRATALVNMASAEPEFISLPLNFQSMRRIRLSSVGGKPYLNYRTPMQIDEARVSSANVTGRPTDFTIFGSEIELCPTPGEAFTVEMVFRANLPSLNSNTSNWLLALAPDVYLYGILLETAPYIKEDGRIQTWGAGYTSAIDGLQRLGLVSTFNSGPLQVRTSGQVF